MKNQGFTLRGRANQEVTSRSNKNSRAASNSKASTAEAEKSTAETEKSPDTSGWMTRIESADLIGMSVSTIANHERRGKLHPRYIYRADSRGIERHVAVYDPEELRKLPRSAIVRDQLRDPGEVAARCFEAFQEGKTIREVVIEQRETYERVKTLRDNWEIAGGAATSVASTGEFEARCFELFGQGKAIREVVVEVRETHDRVRALYEGWLDSGGADLTITPIAKKALEGFIGPFTSVADLIVLIEGLYRRIT